MRRLPFFLIVLVLAAVAGWYWNRSRVPVAPDHLTVFYTKADGSTMGSFDVSVRPRTGSESDAEHLHNVVLYAAVQAVAGPPSDVAAIRFPMGTHVLSASVDGTTATVDLSSDVSKSAGGALTETGEFKGLVYTLTGIPTINAVQITISGQRVESLPGGHLELDTPLHRSDW